MSRWSGRSSPRSLRAGTRRQCPGPTRGSAERKGEVGGAEGGARTCLGANETFKREAFMRSHGTVCAMTTTCGVRVAQAARKHSCGGGRPICIGACSPRWHSATTWRSWSAPTPARAPDRSTPAAFQRTRARSCLRADGSKEQVSYGASASRRAHVRRWAAIRLSASPRPGIPFLCSRPSSCTRV
eukprot:scaffold186336_cov24-Tisochrysis_lutea.AAC.3